MNFRKDLKESSLLRKLHTESVTHYARTDSAITLIALVITIIVLLILAGVSLNLVAGGDGILSRAAIAVNKTNEAKIKEEVELAMAELKTKYYEGRYVTGEIEATTEFNEYAGTELGKKEDNEIVGIKTASGKITLDGTTIYFTETGKTEPSARGEFDEKTGTVTDIKTAGSEKTDNLGDENISSIYLVDKVEIGDYVEIGIDYENKREFTGSENIVTTSALTGWRVLSKSGSGETGTVKLVSAGSPLTYHHVHSSSSESILNLEDLNKELTIVTSGIGFRENGLKLNDTVENDLSKIFTEDKYIDTTKGIHALGCGTNYTDATGIKATAYTPLDEIEEAYKAITGITKKMTELENYSLGTSNLMSVAGGNWKSNYTDLLANGQSYWLGGASYSTVCLWLVGYDGNVPYSNNLTIGIRPVVSLQSGVKIDSNNTGDGTSSNTAYSITK